jgi:hypothetical protein
MDLPGKIGFGAIQFLARTREQSMNDWVRKLLYLIASLVGGYAAARISFLIFRPIAEKLLPLCPPERFDNRCGLMPALQLLAAETCSILVWIAVGLLFYQYLVRKFAAR